MASYNAVNGVPSAANDWLLQTLARDTWMFDGAVVSDCDADADVFNSHHYYATPSEAVAGILRAGTDVDCGGFMGKYAPAALADGHITEADLDTVLLRMFRLLIRLAYFDGPTPLSRIGSHDVCTSDAIEIARDGVRQSVVLAKNDGGVLPLSAGSFHNVVVIGPNLGLADTISYYGPGTGCNFSRYTPLDALQQHVPSALGIKGVPDVGSNDTSGVAAAATAAASADLVFLAIGSDLMLEREGADRTEIGFSAGQLALISAVASAAKGPVIALVFSGGAMDVSPLLANPKIAGVVICGQPSVQVVGVGDVVFGTTLDGRAVVPAGRMTQTTYPASFVDTTSMFEFGVRPGPSVWPPGTNPGRTYKFFTGTPVLPFGYGLSYTTFTYTPVGGDRVVRLDGLTAATAAQEATGVVGHIPASLKEVAVSYYVNVTNTGTVDADDVVLGFVVPPGAGENGVPLRELFGFERVHVAAGQTVTVFLGAQGVRFTQAGTDGVRRPLPGVYTVEFGVAETAAKGQGFATVQTRVE